MSNLAIIPARGGSKRIPRKNIKDFLGRPVIAYSIDAAKKSNLFDEVMVSTDDEEIASISIKYGAKVPFMRSSENATDFSTTVEVLEEVLCKYQSVLNMSFKYACCIYPASPLIDYEDLRIGYNVLLNKSLKVVFPVVAFGHPVWRGFEISERGSAKMIWPENLNARSQDLKEVFHDAGQWYWFDPEKLEGSLLSGNMGVIVLDDTKVQDIDNLVDWKLAELKYKLKYET